MDTNSFVEIYYLEPFMKTDSNWINIIVNLNYEGGKTQLGNFNLLGSSLVTF